MVLTYFVVSCRIIAVSLTWKPTKRTISYRLLFFSRYSSSEITSATTGTTQCIEPPDEKQALVAPRREKHA